ncbi:unnamed protein product, partial [Phaeothamnion confervicola]
PSPEKTCWKAEAAFGGATCAVRCATANDAGLRSRSTIDSLLRAMQTVRDALSAVLALPDAAREYASWVVRNGSCFLLETAEILSLGGHGGHAAPFLTFATLAAEACCALCTTRHLSWRLRLYAATCNAL